MLYNIYTTDGNAPLQITDWEHLRVMRLDFTERQLYNHRYVKRDPSIKHLFKARDKHATLKRIGFVARDFHEMRPSGQLSIRFFSILAKYKKQFSLYFYSLKGHPISQQFMEFGTIKVNDSYNNLAHTITNDEIDILVDMQGFMINNFTDLLLQKPAPIQIHWLGYPGTLGLPTIDYLVADDILIPDKSQKYYREKIAYMPHCYQSNNPDFIQKEQYVKRGYFKLPEDKFIFSHFNSDYKLDRRTWFVWLNILKEVPNSMLVFTVLTSNEQDIFIKQLMNDVKIVGIDITRVRYLKKEERHQHFNRLQMFDLGLDTYRVNGHTTNADLVCAGIPFITYTSATYHNRVAKSILHALDLDELVCNSFDEYTKKAIQLATDKVYYKTVQQKVIDNRCKIMFNTYLYTRSFTNLLYSIWDQYHDHPDGERKELTQIFMNDDGSEEHKIVPFEPLHLTKFNNHYYGTPKFKWMFYKNKICKGHVYKVTDLRKQYLIDYANEDTECVAFTLDGELMNSFEELFESDEPCGVWVKELLGEEDNEEDVYDTLNKDYKLPKICLYFHINRSMPQNSLSEACSYLYTQIYLNAELILISETGPLPSEGIKFIHEHINYIKYIDNYDNRSDEEILRENTEAKICLKISLENLNDLKYVQRIYEDKFSENN
jgi:hypothetical protein